MHVFVLVDGYVTLESAVFPGMFVSIRADGQPDKPSEYTINNAKFTPVAV